MSDGGTDLIGGQRMICIAIKTFAGGGKNNDDEHHATDIPLPGTAIVGPIKNCA